MKKNLSQLFEEATAEELEPIVKQCKTPATPAGMLARVKAKTGFAAKQSRRPFLYAAAACAALVLCAAFALPLLLKGVSEPHIPLESTLPTESDRQITSDVNPTPAATATPTPTPTVEPTVAPTPTPTVTPSTAPTVAPSNAPTPISASEKVSGISQKTIVVSSSLNGAQAELAPPTYRFDFYEGAFIVRAKVTANYPSLYYTLAEVPQAYRLIRLEILDVLRGEGMPKTVLYLLPADRFTDLSVYDSLILSMRQVGIADYYVLRNDTESRMESFPFPVFNDTWGIPERGNIMAYRDGVLDEGLWQKKGWNEAYAFRQKYPYLYEEEDALFTRCRTEAEAFAEISRIAAKFDAPKLYTPSFSSQEALDALAYVKPFANGVFAQAIYSDSIFFRRYINGCMTDETVAIDLETGKVTHSEARYSAEELSAMENIAARLAEKAAAYEKKTPVPPHVDPKGKKLTWLNLFAWYAKADGKPYGVVKTRWEYVEEKNQYVGYGDEEYILYDITAGSVRTVSQEELIALFKTDVHLGFIGKTDLPSVL